MAHQRWKGFALIWFDLNWKKVNLLGRWSDCEMGQYEKKLYRLTCISNDGNSKFLVWLLHWIDVHCIQNALISHSMAVRLDGMALRTIWMSIRVKMLAGCGLVDGPIMKIIWPACLTLQWICHQCEWKNVVAAIKYARRQYVTLSCRHRRCRLSYVLYVRPHKLLPFTFSFYLNAVWIVVCNVIDVVNCMSNGYLFIVLLFFLFISRWCFGFVFCFICIFSFFLFPFRFFFISLRWARAINTANIAFFFWSLAKLYVWCSWCGAFFWFDQVREKKNR